MILLRLFIKNFKKHIQVFGISLFKILMESSVVTSWLIHVNCALNFQYCDFSKHLWEKWMQVSHMEVACELKS